MSLANPPHRPLKVVGLDLSLTSTGLAYRAGDQTGTERIAPRGLDGLSRIRAIAGQVVLACDGADLVVLEGPAYGSARGKQQGHHERAGLWWMVLDALQRRDLEVAIVPPNLRAKYATGKGNASKAAVIREITRRFAWFGGEEDEADAVALMAMGCDHLGAPLAPMPVLHRAALEGVSWPVREAA